MKKIYVLILVLVLFLISACTSELNPNDQQNYEDYGDYVEEPVPLYSPPTLKSCLARCEEPDIKTANELPISQQQYPSNYHNCQVSCYNQRAQSTKLQADCNPILEFARQNPDGYYPRYFYCVIDAVGLSDPALCDVARDDTNLRTNYPYCINKIAIKTKDATICERLSGIDQDNFYHDNCVSAIERGY